MKKALSLALAFLLIFGLLPATAAADEVYTVSVTGGTADPASAAEGESVTITANAAPEGQRFKEWSGADGLTFAEGSSAAASPATFTMPAGHVSLTANYEEIPAAASTCAVTVTGGTANREYAAAGERVTITAGSPPPGQQFAEWGGAADLQFVNGGAGTSPAEFIMPAHAVSLTAIYAEPVASLYSVTVVSGAADKTSAAAGASVTVTANAAPEGQRFREWRTTEDLIFAEGSSATVSPATFTMPAGAVALTAVYEEIPAAATLYSVTVTGGAADPASAAADTSVTVTADAAPEGQRFKEWTGADGLSFAEGSSATASPAAFTMPARAVALTAVYEEIPSSTPIYTVTLKAGDGTGSDVVYRSDEGEIADDFHGASNGQFYRDGDGMGFRFDYTACPDGWTAPSGYEFNNFGSGAAFYNSLSQTNTVYTAQWRLSGDASITFSPAALVFDFDSFDAQGFLPLSLTVTDLDFGPNAGGSEHVSVFFSSFELSGGATRLGFGVYSADHGEGGRSILFSLYGTQTTPITLQLALQIDPQTLAAAERTTYSAEWDIELLWHDLGGSPAPNHVKIPVTLGPPYSVAVTNGTADRTSAAAGASVTVTADPPPSGKIFKEWSGADELSFTSGSRTASPATFTMPAQAVALTAVYQEVPASLPTFAVTVTGGTTDTDSAAEGESVTITAAPPEGQRFVQWTGTDGLTFVSGGSDSLTATFTMPARAVALTAVCEVIPTTCTLLFDPNVPDSASTAYRGSMGSQTVTCGGGSSLLIPVGFSLPGYAFSGWNTHADGSGTPYADESQIICASADAGKTITLYAQWTPKKYTITFRSDAAGTRTYIQTAEFDKAWTLDTLAQIGWTSGIRSFFGWSNGTDLFYDDGEEFCNLCGAPDASGNLSDVTLTAVWDERGRISVAVTKDGVPQTGLASCFVLVNGATQYNNLFSFDSDTLSYRFDWDTDIIFPDDGYEVLFAASGYPSASLQIDNYSPMSAFDYVLDFYTVSIVKDSAYADFNEVAIISGGAPVAGSPNTVLALDGSSLKIKTTLNEAFRLVRYAVVGVPPTWESYDPPAAEQTIVVNGKADIKARVGLIEYSVTASPGPAAGGSVTGGGTFYYGETATVTATPNAGWRFVNWTNNGSPACTDARYSFVPTADCDLVANFVRRFTVSVVAKPAAGGTVSGGGTYDENASPTLTAAPAEGYRFVNWTEDGEEVSTDAEYVFTADADRDLVANFIPEYIVTYKVENGAWSDGGTQELTETVVQGGSPAQVPAGMKPSPGFTGGAWDSEPSEAVIDAPTVFTFSFEPFEYTVDSGGSAVWTKGSGKSVSFTVHRSVADDECFTHYSETLVDGNPAAVAAASGSTVITFSPETLGKLGVGKHTVTVKFDDGKVACTLTIKAAPRNHSNPPTGDDSGLGLWVALLCLSLAGSAALLPFLGKKRRRR